MEIIMGMGFGFVIMSIVQRVIARIQRDRICTWLDSIQVQVTASQFDASFTSNLVKSAREDVEYILW